MSHAISLASPIQPHELPKPMRREMSDLARQVVMRATRDSVSGDDILIRVYLAGMYHGATLAKAGSQS